MRWFLNNIFGWSSVSRFMKVGKIMLFAISLLYVTVVFYQNVLGYKILDVSVDNLRIFINLIYDLIRTVVTHILYGQNNIKFETLQVACCYNNKYEGETKMCFRLWEDKENWIGKKLQILVRNRQMRTNVKT